MLPAKSELKTWAKEHMKGLETCTIPSFTPDLSDLDEEGIRWDVQQQIKHGFFSTLADKVGLSFQETKRMMEIVTDEAKDKIQVAVPATFESVDETIEILKHGEKIGCSHAMLGLPSTFFPASEDDIYEYTKKICDTTGLPIYIYTTHKINYEKIYSSGFSPELLKRLADIENIVALKIGSGDFGYITECFQTCKDRLLVNVASVGMAPLLCSTYGQQWIGAAVYELYQSPEKPYLVNAFNLLLEGKTEEALKIYRTIQPVIALFERQMMPMIMLGAYHWALLKYYQWCTGSNGGLIRHALRLHGGQLMEVKFAIGAAGLTPREPNEEFFVGRTRYAKMKKG